MYMNWASGKDPISMDSTVTKQALKYISVACQTLFFFLLIKQFRSHNDTLQGNS